MEDRRKRPYRTLATGVAALVGAIALSGCVSLVVGAAMVATDVAVGTVKLAGKAVGAAADLVIPERKPDGK